MLRHCTNVENQISNLIRCSVLLVVCAFSHQVHNLILYFVGNVGEREASGGQADQGQDHDQQEHREKPDRPDQVKAHTCRKQ